MATPPTSAPPNSPSRIDLTCSEKMPNLHAICEMQTRKCKRWDSEGSSDDEEIEHVNKKQQIFDLECEIVPETPLNSQGEVIRDSNLVSYSPDHSPPPEDRQYISGAPTTFEEWLAAVKSKGRYAITLGKQEYYEQAKHAIQSMLGCTMDVEEYLIHVASAGLSNGKAPAPSGCLFPCEYKAKHSTLFAAFLEGEEEGAEARLLQFLLDTKVFPKTRFERSRCLNVATLLREMPMYETLRIAIYLMAVIAKEDVDALF